MIVESRRCKKDACTVMTRGQMAVSQGGAAESRDSQERRGERRFCAWYGSQIFVVILSVASTGCICDHPHIGRVVAARRVRDQTETGS